MPQYIMRAEHPNTKEPHYFMWSTVVDAPVTFAMPLKKFRKWYRRKFGTHAIAELEYRLLKADQTGTSALMESFNDLIRSNKMGDKQSKLSKEEVLKFVFKL